MSTECRLSLREGSADRMEIEVVVHFHEFIHCILFENHEFIQIGIRLKGAVETMDDMLFVNFFDKQHIEDFQFTIDAIVRGFVFAPPVPSDLTSDTIDEL